MEKIGEKMRDLAEMGKSFNFNKNSKIRWIIYRISLSFLSRFLYEKSIIISEIKDLTVSEGKGGGLLNRKGIKIEEFLLIGVVK